MKDKPLRIRVGVSACLLGERVRYDGGDKKDQFLTHHFGRFVEWVPLCPEVGIGLGVPREPIQLVDQNHGVRLVAAASGLDHTEKMVRWTDEQAKMIARQELCGYVLKRNSPSCGMERVKVFRGTRVPVHYGTQIALLILCAPTNRLRDLTALAPAAITALACILILAQSLFFKAPNVRNVRRPGPGAKLRSPCRPVAYVHDRRLDAASDGRVMAVLPV